MADPKITQIVVSFDHGDRSGGVLITDELAGFLYSEPDALGHIVVDAIDRLIEGQSDG